MSGVISLLGGGLQNFVAGASGSSGAQLPTLFDMQALPDVAGAWLWTANVVGVPGLPAFNNLILADANVPFEGYGSDPRFRGGFTYNFPKFTNVTPLTLTFHELQTFIVTNFLMSWKNKVVNPLTGDYYLPHDYYGEVTITLFDGMGIPALEITLTGVWPERVNDLNLVTTGSNALQVSVNFAVNRSNVTYASATLLDSPLAQIVSNNPIAGLRNLATLGFASAKSSAFQAAGSAFSSSGISSSLGKLL